MKFHTTPSSALQVAFLLREKAIGKSSPSQSRLVPYQTPFYSTLSLQFEGDRLLFDSEHNVAFGPTKQPQVIGKHKERYAIPEPLASAFGKCAHTITRSEFRRAFAKHSLIRVCTDQRRLLRCPVQTLNRQVTNRQPKRVRQGSVVIGNRHQSKLERLGEIQLSAFFQLL